MVERRTLMKSRMRVGIEHNLENQQFIGINMTPSSTAVVERPGRKSGTKS